MSFSSLLEEANNTLDSDTDQALPHWSGDSNDTTSPSVKLTEIKEEPILTPNSNTPNLNLVKQEIGYVPNAEFALDTLYGNNMSKQFPSYDVRTEPNPYYHNGMQNPMYFQQPMFHQRTHLPVQYDEYYNMNSLPKHNFIVNNQNAQNLFHLQKGLSQNILPQNRKTEKNRKRSTKKAVPRKKVKIEFNGPPPNWKPIYDNLMEMRKNIVAPVDVMGCFKNAESDRGPKIYRYQVMISLMLSSQTKDEVTAGAMTRLKKFGLTPKNIAETEESKLAGLIHPVGFWQKKATYIKNASHIVHSEHDDDIPNSVDGLTSLPGIGPKMAHLCMEFAWNKLTGISVDTHVHRICQRIGWTPPGLKQPDDTRKLLEHWLPKEEWGRINLLMVGFGQVVCLPTKPRCFECKNQTLCPYAINNPDRTCTKTLNNTKPSARNQKYVEHQQLQNGIKQEPKKEVKTEVKQEQDTTPNKDSAPSTPSYAYQNPYNNSQYTPPNSAPFTPQPYSSHVTNLPSHVTQSSSHVTSHPMVLASPDAYQPSTYAPFSAHLNGPVYTKEAAGNFIQIKQEPIYAVPPHPNLKLDLVSDRMIYHTLTPTVSPHDQQHHYYPYVMAPNSAPSPMSCIQSPMIDTTTSPLINPLNNESTNFTQKLNGAMPQPGANHVISKTDNVLDNFLDW